MKIFDVKSLSDNFLNRLRSKNRIFIFSVESKMHYFLYFYSNNSIKTYKQTKKIIIMNHNKRKFIFWSSEEAKKKVALQSLLYILKENATIRKNYDNFAPFGEKINQSNQNDLNEMYRSSSSAKNARKKKLIKALFIRKPSKTQLMPLVQPYLLLNSGTKIECYHCVLYA